MSQKFIIWEIFNPEDESYPSIYRWMIKKGHVTVISETLFKGINSCKKSLKYHCKLLFNYHLPNKKMKYRSRSNLDFIL